MSIFNLKTSPSELKSSNVGISDSKYHRVAPYPNVIPERFGNDTLSFEFKTSGTRWWVPSKSYVRVRVTMTDPTGTQLDNDDNLGLAPGAGACLFQGAELLMNGSVVSRISDNLPIIYAEHIRTSKSKSWLATVAKSSNAWTADIGEQKNFISSNHTSGSVSNGKTSVELVFQPPLSIFKIDHALPAGNFELRLIPQSGGRHRTSAVEYMTKTGAPKVPDTHYKFEVNEVHLFNHYVEGDRMDNASFYLDLEETGVHVRNLKAESGEQTEVFTVKPSTYAITTLLQNSASTTNTQFPPTKFITSESKENTLTRLRLEYAGNTVPSPEYVGVLDGTSNYTTERYFNNQLETSAYFDTGGTETLDDYYKFGPYNYFNFPKDGLDRSTHLSATLTFDNTAGDTRLIVLDKYRKVGLIQIEQGTYTKVQVEDA
jgi:hypothetical protein